MQNRRVRSARLPRAGALIPEETALALTYNGGSYAVMMGTPQDLADFGIGFILGEGIIRSPDDLRSLDIVHLDDGIELRMWLARSTADRLNERRRHIAGPTGCGLCGIDSIAEAVRPAAIVGQGREFSPQQIMSAMQSVPSLQTINIETRAVHAAAFWTPARGIAALREDVGRHNALDKLAGALAQQNIAAGDGVILLTSRVSVEMVQKAAAIGAPLMVAVSAPTALAVRMADATGITLVAIARMTALKFSPAPAGLHPGRQPAELSMSSPDRLIYLANQIGKFFHSQGHDKAVPGIAEHIRKFWDPRMRSAISAHLDAGGAGLDSEVRDAIETLRNAGMQC